MSDVAETTEIEILDPEKPIAAYNPIRAGIEAMYEKYGKTVFSVATTKDMEAAKEARVEIRDVRYKIEHVRKALKEPALAYSKRIDEEAREYTDAILKIETPIDEQIKAEEKRKADEKAEREAAAAERARAIQIDVDAIKDMAIKYAGKPSQVIFAAIEVCASVEITLERFRERAGEAEIAKQQTLTKMQEMHTAAVAQENEAARLKAEREELERQKAAQEKAAAEARKVEEDRIAAERAKLAAEQAEAKRIREAEAEKLRKEREEIEAKQAAERKRQADAQADIDRQRKEIEDAKAAAAKAEQDRLDKIAADEQAKRDAEAKAAQDKADAEAAAAKKKADDEAAEAARREQVQFEQNGPGDEAIIETLVTHYRASPEAVWRWLSAMALRAQAEAA